MISLYEELTTEYPLISIEDGLDEDDWEGWQELTKRMKEQVMLVGDDLFVTNVKRIRCGMDLKVANGVLIKVNQIGTLTEAMDAIELAQKNGYKAIIHIVPARNGRFFYCRSRGGGKCRLDQDRRSVQRRAHCQV